MTKMKNMLLKSLDTSVCLLVITPLTFLWWSGTWHLMRIYCTDFQLEGSWDSDLSSALTSLLLGSVLCVSGNIILPTVICKILNFSDLKSLIIVRLYVYIFSIGYLNFWRGLWNIMNIVTNTSDKSHQYFIAYIVFGVAFVILLLLRTTSCLVGVPFSVSLDKTSHFCQISLCFGSQCSREEAGAFIADILVSVFFVGSLGVAVWWSLWSVTNAWISFVQSPLWTNVTFLSIGYGLSLVLTVLSTPLRLLAGKLHSMHRLLSYVFVVFVHLTATLSALLIWKGGWDMCDDYILNGSEWRSWVCHLAGFSGLLLLQVCSILAPFGCAVDDMDNIDLNNCFPTVYFGNIPACSSPVLQENDCPDTERFPEGPMEYSPLINT